MFQKASWILALTLLVGCAPSSPKVTTVRLDFATFNPVSLVLKAKGWLEEELREEGIAVEWTQVISGPQAIGFIQAGNLDFASSAVTAALVNYANGVPIRVVYVFSQPEWTALVTRPDTGIRSVTDLKGRRVAAPHGTDPFLFLVRALEKHGLSEQDIEVVPLAHPDGAAALASKAVDAWAGLDPMMARLELSGQAILFYRDRSIPSYGVLCVGSAFAEKNPELVVRVLRVYERARQWARDNLEETADILASVAQLDRSIALHTLTTRTAFPSAVPGAEVRATLGEALRIFKKTGNIKSEVDDAEVLAGLLDTRFVERALGSEP